MTSRDGSVDGDGGVGRFLFISNILCMTADETGAFRPSDVFGSCVHPTHTHTVPRGSGGFAATGDTALCAPACTAPPHTSAAVTAMQATTTTTPTAPYTDIDDDDVIVNTFGVVSGTGVLVDAWRRCFVDCADVHAYTPGTLAAVDEDDGDAAAAAARATCACHNARAYLRGRLEEVRAEAVLTLCAPRSSSSPSSRLCDGDGLSDACAWGVCSPRRCSSSSNQGSHLGGPFEGGRQRQRWLLPAPAFSSRQDATHHARRRCRAVQSRLCTALRHHRRAEDAAAVRLWHDVERLCLLVQSAATAAAAPRETYLPTAIPFRFQCGGAVLQRPPMPATVAAAAARLAGPHVTCYTGKPSLIRGRYSSARNDLSVRHDSHRAAHVLRRRLRPWCTAAAPTRARTTITTTTTTDTTTTTTTTTNTTTDTTTDEHACALDDDDCTALPRVPDTLTSPQARAWWLFRVFYAHLGITAVRGDHVDDAAVSTFTLCPDDAYDMAAQLARRRRRRRQRDKGTASSSSSSSSPTRAVTVTEIAHAWTYFMLHSTVSMQRRLLRRLTRLEAYLHEHACTTT